MAERTSQGLTLAIDADAPPKRAVDVALGNDPALPPDPRWTATLIKPAEGSEPAHDVAQFTGSEPTCWKPLRERSGAISAKSVSNLIQKIYGRMCW